MTEVADFLRTRIAERRALAEAATEGPWEGVVDHHQRGVVDASVWSDKLGYYITEKISSGERHEADALHIAANDPAAVIADCDAKLAIVDMHPPEEIPEHSRRSWQGFTIQCASESWKVYSDAENRVEYPCRTLRLLAQPFAGHPDHKGEEWAP